MREKISVAAVVTIIVVVNAVIIANWSRVLQVLAIAADTAGSK